MSGTTTTYDYLQHMTSGDIFAVEFGSGQQVLRSFGPIARRELQYDPADFAQSMGTEDNDWMDGVEFRLIEGAVLAQMIGEAHEADDAE